mmetsp:Transcript_24788/g.41422  ORF Transcript_24788/g.41422 Transcript_24788/m.41422 type:complete len:314 (+) Transcript_24788:155-1096(+)
MAGMLQKWFEYERTFDGQQWIDFTREHADIPIFAVAAYLIIVFYVPTVLKNREKFNLKPAFAAWNLFLAVFSAVGLTRTVPHLWNAVQEHGFKWTICTDPAEWYNNGPCGLWVGLFIYSKIPELLDTVFLVLQKKRVIFLAWFHHTTVLLYCWHAYHNRIGPGLWFASANYTVHTVMYTYYFLMAAGLHKLARPCASLITTLQIAQMMMGTTVTAYSAIWSQTEQCKVDPANYKMGLAMYVSYFWLFAVLFINKYFGPKAPGAKADTAPARVRRQDSRDMDITMCGVDLGTHDAAGFFHSSGTRSKPDLTKLE